jgi:hypothetical protein
MKLIAKAVLATLMVAGTISAIASPSAPKTTGFSDGGPAPLCYPGDPGCKPPIPPAAK